MTGPEGKPVERYEYTPFGDQTILVDSTPPAVEQVRWVAGELWLEMSEEVSAEALADAVSAGTLTLEDTLAAQDLPISVSQPVEEGRQARQRVVITPADPLPADGTELTLTLPPESLKDLFLNEPAGAFTLTFNWPAADAVLLDDVPPKVEQVVVVDGFLEVQLSEEPDVAAATSAITLDGQPLVWTLQADGYTLRSDSTLALGSHTLAVGAGLLDLQGQPLAQPESFVFEVGAAIDDVLVYQAPDPRVTPTSTVGNRVGFQGHEKDLETGLVYIRNRYYDPELGRFITTDPMGYVDGPSMYQFAGYSPVNFGDPLGLETKAEWQALLKKEMLEKYGVDLDDWDPSKGFEHNKEIVKAVYQWYSDMFREHDYMPWVGLARMVGAPVVEGLEQSERGRLASYLSMEFGPLARFYVAVMQVGFLTINRDIFMDLAWHHKAYAEKGIDEIEERWATREIDYEATEGWRLVDQGRRAGDSERIWEGNLLFALREQRDVVNRGYSLLRQARGLIRIMSELARSPVPGGHRFDDVADQPSDISRFYGQRWKWLLMDMWPAWKAMSRKEQLRYTQMPLEQLMKVARSW